MASKFVISGACAISNYPREGEFGSIQLKMKLMMAHQSKVKPPDVKKQNIDTDKKKVIESSDNSRKRAQTKR